MRGWIGTNVFRRRPPLWRAKWPRPGSLPPRRRRSASIAPNWWSEIQKLKPQIDAYTAQVQEIEAEFGRELESVLTPAQREKRVAYLKRREESDAKVLASKAPLFDDDILKAQDRPLTDIYWMVTVTPVLERITKEYGLDSAQQTAVRSLLVLRRNKYTALFRCDSAPWSTHQSLGSFAGAGGGEKARNSRPSERVPRRELRRS
jgi:hypothetical protein